MQCYMLYKSENGSALMSEFEIQSYFNDIFCSPQQKLDILFNFFSVQMGHQNIARSSKN